MKNKQKQIIKIISGGQTGVDTGVLNFAIYNGIDYGGFVCKNGKREDKKNAIKLFPKLTELKNSSYAHRTIKNIENSDATLIVIDKTGKMGTGTKLTFNYCKNHSVPVFVYKAIIDKRYRHTVYTSKIFAWLNSIKKK